MGMLVKCDVFSDCCVCNILLHEIWFVMPDVVLLFNFIAIIIDA
jgi:hypothetical protein